MIEMYLLLPACLARPTYNDEVLAKTLHQKYKLLPQYTASNVRLVRRTIKAFFLVEVYP